MELIAGIIAICFAAAVVAGVALRWPMSAVCLFLALTLSNVTGIMVNAYGLPSIGTPMVACLVALLLIRAMAGREELSGVSTLLVPALALFATLALRMPWVDDTAACSAKVIEFGKNLMILLVLVGFLTDFQRLRAAVWTASLTIGALAALSVVQDLTKSFDNNFFGFANAALQHITGEQNGWRPSGPLPDPNFYAQLLMLSLPLSTTLMITETRWSLRALAAAAAAATVFAIVLTYSRGALLGLALLALAYAITSRHRKVLVFVAVAVVALAMVLLPADLFERVTAGIESGSQLLGDGNISGDPAVIQRMSAMRAALRMFYDNPLFGIGPGQFSSTYQSYALAYNLDMWAPPAAHSLYLEIAAEQGVLGLAIFAALIVTALVLTGRAAGQFSARGAFGEASLVRALGYVIVGYLATAIFLHDAFPRFFWVFFALTVSSWQIASGNSAKNKPLSVELDYVQRTT